MEVARSEGWIALPQSGSLLRLASGQGAEPNFSDGEDDFPLPAKDPSHTCPKCGEVPWAPADGFGRMCDACGWSWQIDRPHEGRYVSQGPSTDVIEMMERVLADARGELEGHPLLAGHVEVPWTGEDFAVWVELRKAHGDEAEPDWVDVVHSDLLARIAIGGPVFRDPPPLRYSYPWVSLCRRVGHRWDPGRRPR